MNEIIPGIIVTLVTAVGVGILFLLIGRKKAKKEAQIRELASRNKWVFEKVQSQNQSGFVLKHADWTFESIASCSGRSSEAGSSDVTHVTRWVSNLVRLEDGLVLIGPKLPSIQLGAFGSALLQQGLRLILGEDTDKAAELHEVVVGRISFRERYSVWAASEDAANKALTFGVENALLNWRLMEQPVIKFSSKGIEIKLLEGSFDTPEKIRNVIELGKVFIY